MKYEEGRIYKVKKNFKIRAGEDSIIKKVKCVKVYKYFALFDFGLWKETIHNYDSDIEILKCY